MSLQKVAIIGTGGFGREVLDVIHESLLRHWPRLRGWIAAESKAADELQRLVRDALSQRDGQRGLLREPELSLFERLLREQVPSAAW